MRLLALMASKVRQGRPVSVTTPGAISALPLVSGSSFRSLVPMLLCFLDDRSRSHRVKLIQGRQGNLGHLGGSSLVRGTVGNAARDFGKHPSTTDGGSFDGEPRI